MRARPLLPRSPLCASGAALVALAGAALAAPSAGDVPTFARDVAPIVWQSCAVCHRAGESGPFPLTSYEEVARRAKTIAAVTQAGIMPPWLPERGDHALLDERRLSADEIDTLRRWAEAGAPLGDPDQVPALPRWPLGWQLGEPDLVVEFPAEKAFELAAEGPDVFRNFVVSVPLERSRWVRAFELRPGDTTAIHHARLQLDQGESCAHLEAADPLPGFPGMGMGESAPPDGHLLGWTPGKAPRPAPPGTAWELPPDGDLVLQLHLTPTGKPELVRPRIGLYFADGPPRHTLHSTLLFSEDIFLPAGAREVRITDELVLPVDVQLLAVYPHAHYLGKSIVAEALHRDGRAEELLRIDEWDFDWQDEYHFREPVRLAAGVRLRMEWTFDNSEANPHNPYHPPRPVRYGLESADEMATLSFAMLPASADDLSALHASAAEHTLAKRPDDPEVQGALGVALIEMGRLDEAERVLARSLELQPGSASTWTNLGLARLRQGQAEQALAALQRALELDPGSTTANLHYGRVLMQLGHSKKALNHYKIALEQRPGMVDVRADWASLLALTGRTGSAIRQYELVLAAEPDNASAHNNLASALAATERPAEALPHYLRAIELRPDFFDARLNLGKTLLDLQRPAEALPHLREALRLKPGDPAAVAALERASAR